MTVATDYTDLKVGHAIVLRREGHITQADGLRPAWRIRCGCGEEVVRSSSYIRVALKIKGASLYCDECGKKSRAVRSKGRWRGGFGYRWSNKKETVDGNQDQGNGLCRETTEEAEGAEDAAREGSG